jgi:ribonuclease BN (tRNA processing enzyme)
MKLVLLGTGGYYANERRHTACLMLPEVGVVLDAGTGMFRLEDYLAADSLSAGRLDVFLTHAHLDHVLGLTYVLSVLTKEMQKRTTVHGEAAKLEAIRTHLFAEALFPVMPAFRMQPLAGEVALAGGGKLSYFPLVHPGGSVGYRLDWPGSSLAYVTDTRASADAAYVERIRGVNLLVHEANFDDDDEEMAEITGHSCLSDVARVAAAAEVGLLVLVHVDPQLERNASFDLRPAKEIFKNTLLGADRMEIEF